VVESRSRDTECDDGGAVWVSALTLVDLAGSERLGKTGERDPANFERPRRESAAEKSRKSWNGGWPTWWLFFQVSSVAASEPRRRNTSAGENEHAACYAAPEPRNIHSRQLPPSIETYVPPAAGAEGLRAKEGAMINKSLLTLGTVINKLAEGVQINGEQRRLTFAAAFAWRLGVEASCRRFCRAYWCSQAAAKDCKMKFVRAQHNVPVEQLDSSTLIQTLDPVNPVQAGTCLTATPSSREFCSPRLVGMPRPPSSAPSRR